MRTPLLLTLLFSVLPALAASQPRAPGIETQGYVWNKADPETTKALTRKADVAKGREAYKVCRGCHKKDASGQPNGDYPQLAGQHASVLIKQMADVRAGRRDSHKMSPFINKDLVSTEDLADIAGYLASLPPPANTGKGDGKKLDQGKTLYDKDCASCHGKGGEGDGKQFHPKVSNQHYRYLLRQTLESRDEGRRNSNPDMVKVLKSYSDKDVEAVSDYMSRLPMAKK